MNIVNIYTSRVQIEETFRDAKNHRFGWAFEDVKSHCADRLRAILLIAAIAMLAMNLIGLAAEKRGLQHYYQANTQKNDAFYPCSISHKLSCSIPGHPSYVGIVWTRICDK